MKKIIGITGTVAIAMAMFFSANTINSSNGDLDLASLLKLNNANAECSIETMLAYCYFGGLCIIKCGDGDYSTYAYGLSNTQ